MNKRVERTAAFLTAILLILFSCACFPSDAPDLQPQKEPVNLIYYTIGNPDRDLAKVNSALNDMLYEKLGITITYNKIAWNDYHTRLTAIIHSGAYFDIAFASNSAQGDYIGNAAKGVWLPLDDYFDTLGKEMYEVIDPIYWDGIRYKGKIYGIPTNKETCVPEMFMFAKELVDKYDIDISKLTTIESLAPILSLVASEDPEYIPFDFDSNARNLFAQDAYESLIDYLPLMINSYDKTCTIFNVLETSLGKARIAMMRQYYQNGYINEDAAIKESGGLTAGEKVFCKMSSGGPYSDVAWSRDRGYDIVTQQISPKIVTTESTRGGIMAVSSKTQYPDECVSFLNALNTDPDIRNLINFGIEDVHYTLTSSGQVHQISDAYTGVQYTQGNWFILKTTEGEPLDKWAEFRRFNRSATKSAALGFTPDTSSFAQELEACSKICDRYYAALMTGSVDNVVYLPRYLSELKAAGLDKIQSILQQQINIWLREKNTVT